MLLPDIDLVFGVGVDVNRLEPAQFGPTAVLVYYPHCTLQDGLFEKKLTQPLLSEPTIDLVVASPNRDHTNTEVPRNSLDPKAELVITIPSIEVLVKRF